MNVRQAIARLVDGANLTEPEMVEVMNQVMTGEATPTQVVVYGSSGQGVYLSGLPDPFQVFEVEQAGDLDLDLSPVTGQ